MAEPVRMDEDRGFGVPGSADGPWAQFVVEPDKRGIGTVRLLAPHRADRRRLFCREPQEADADKPLQPAPAWLDMAHKTLDEAVFAA